MNTLVQPIIPKDYNAVFDNLDVAESTRIDYCYRLPLFVSFVNLHGFTTNTYLDYKKHLRAMTWSVSTKNKHLIVARVFLKELHRQGLIPTDITHNVKAFKQSKKHKKRGLNDAEAKRLATWLSELPDTPENDRLKAIFSLLLLQGLRLVEVCRLDVEDLDLDNEILSVLGKGQDDKEPILLMPQTITYLRQYLRSNETKEGALFRSNSHSRMGQRLSTRGLREIVMVIFKKLHIHKTAHGTRHYYTSQLLKIMPGHLLDVAHYTRHRSVEMLRVYDNRNRQDYTLDKVAAAFAGINF
ncbi:tyrosine-type recombinase/integrase [Candidatus Saccharibacteria bacterium]|nr:tyrosine-type recombinase/integrase [Candidatus Saccharibacteria bacterium]